MASHRHPINLGLHALDPCLLNDGIAVVSLVSKQMSGIHARMYLGVEPPFVRSIS
jgi:hypothetical protein